MVEEEREQLWRKPERFRRPTKESSQVRPETVKARRASVEANRRAWRGDATHPGACTRQSTKQRCDVCGTVLEDHEPLGTRACPRRARQGLQRPVRNALHPSGASYGFDNVTAIDSTARFGVTGASRETGHQRFRSGGLFSFCGGSARDALSGSEHVFDRDDLGERDDLLGQRGVDLGRELAGHREH